MTMCLSAKQLGKQTKKEHCQKNSINQRKIQLQTQTKRERNGYKRCQREKGVTLK